MKLMNLIRLTMPISKKNEALLENIKLIKNYKKIKSLVKQKRISIEEKRILLNVTNNLVLIELLSKEKELSDIVETSNKEVRKKKLEEVYQQFSKVAYERIKECIASNILGLDNMKCAVMLQLFSIERFHILLLGDPGVGKSQILNSITKLSPIHSFGLGSGTTNAGLAITIKGKEVKPGLLAMANNGICVIDELNLMKKEDRASFYSTMEEGIIRFDKGGHHYQFDAKTRILATANPKGDRFSSSIEKIKEQVPFDPALLSRFHLVMIIKRPDLDKFIDIAKKIIKDEKKNINEDDYMFIQGYINYASRITNINFSKEYEDEVVNFVTKIKKNERNYLIEVSPRLIKGIINLSKASARLELRTKVDRKDLQRSFMIFQESLEL